ncbi:Immune inhibitor A peptidase M6 [Seminavis robusta]|uniref:Immune inhibitor A peptidase M6 n=1 Tax=Seminavis robusta TaxID=568900 RepID=A0A9N8EC45_9STRA|nr:Immune inhibitor A peptidase M6 [Seminavis robusta]|eukprot:Sro740_g195530.1 Immune inhibitor A peptidase M6 (640) ;mRNA; r:21472-23648
MMGLPWTVISWLLWIPLAAVLGSSSHVYNHSSTGIITPVLAHPRLCENDDTDDNSCHGMVESMKRQWRQQQRRNLQRGSHNPNLGNFKALVLLVQFTDHGNRNLIPKATIEELWNGQIKDWFNVNSHGKYTVDPVIIDWQMTDNTEQYYAIGKSGLDPSLPKAMWPILNRLDAEPGWDWSQFDVDQDGKLDSVVMLHSGISAVVGGDDCFNTGFADRIWPHAYINSVDPNSWRSEDGNFKMGGYTVNSVYDDVCDDKPMTAGLTCHEYMHTFDLIDLYDGIDLSAAKGVGAWDVMGHPYGADHKGIPGLLSTWSKMAAEWITPTLITKDGVYTVQPAHDNPSAYRIELLKTADGLFDSKAEYLLIENRQPTGFFEKPLWGSGLLIVHVDDGAEGMNNRGYKGQDGWPQNGNHYQVAVVQKDGNYDLELNVNYGDEGDLFVPGDTLGPGKQSDGSIVYPNTDSYQGGNIVETGIVIEVLEQVGSDFTFRVSGITQQPTSGGGDVVVISNPTSAPAAPTTVPAAPTQEPTSGGGDVVVISNPTGVPAPTTTVPAPTTDVPAPTTNVPAPIAVSGASPTDAPRWVLTRPPFATQAPFDFPEFPLPEPAPTDPPTNSRAADAGVSVVPGLALVFAGLVAALGV